jgi:hypothetical protein
VARLNQALNTTFEIRLPSAQSGGDVPDEVRVTPHHAAGEQFSETITKIGSPHRGPHSTLVSASTLRRADDCTWKAGIRRMASLTCVVGIAGPKRAHAGAIPGRGC